MNQLNVPKQYYQGNRLKLQLLPMVFSGFYCLQTAFAVDFDFAPPGYPAGGIGERFAYLSEEISGLCNDASDVQDLIFQHGQTGTLIVDEFCKLDSGLRLPSRFTLKGNGIGNIGAFAFDHDGIALSVCPEEPRGYVTIADRDLYGPYRNGNSVSTTHSDELVDKPNAFLRQKNFDARWTKVNYISYYGYKNHVGDENKNKPVRRYQVGSASVHDSQVLDKLLDSPFRGSNRSSDFMS